MRKHKSYIFFLLFAFLCISCTQNLDIEEPQGPEISFLPSVVTALDVTKAPADSILPQFDFIDQTGGISFPLAGFCSVNEDSPFNLPDTTSTKGGIEWENLPETINTMYVAAYKADNTKFVGTSDDYAEAQKDQTTGKWTLSPSVNWDKKYLADRTFYAYANAGPGQSMSCSSSTSQTLEIDMENAQNDVILGVYKGKTEDANGKQTGIVPLSFRHPMTAVKFVQGNLDGVVSIESITLKGIYSKAEITQDADGNLTVSNQPTPTETQVSISINEFYYLIPQDFEKNKVFVTVTFKLEAGGTSTATAVLDRGSWKPGYKYTYTLTDNTCGVTIEGDLDSGIYFKNTSTNRVYVRAAFIGTVVVDNIVVGQNALGISGASASSDDFYYFGEIPIGGSTIDKKVFINKNENTRVQILVQSSKEGWK